MPPGCPIAALRAKLREAAELSDFSGPRGLAALASLASLLERRIRIIDVGCRWGPSGAWEVLAPYSDLIGFDPDPQECRRLSDRYSGDPSRQFVPAALGEKAGPALLHLTAEPACSSLYPPDPDLIEHRPSLKLTSPAGTREVHLETLDGWLTGNGRRGADLLKIDTQGAELRVLQGATGSLQSIRAVETEVQFNPIYRGVPLFADVDAFLREHGFVLWRVENIVHYGLPGGLSEFDRPDVQYFDDAGVEFIGKGGQITWANAFYLAADLVYPGGSPGWQQCLVDACVTGALGFWDLSAAMAGRARKIAPETAARRIGEAYSGVEGAPALLP